VAKFSEALLRSNKWTFRRLNPMNLPRILTIGHSNHPIDRFLDLLSQAGVTAVADVRSRPASRFAPQFNRDELARLLDAKHVAYRFLGNALGGRPKSPDLFSNGVADYEKMANQPEFVAALERIIDATTRYRIALMCSESNPLDCHRCLLIGRRLAEHRVEVGHMLGSGEVYTHDQVEERLLNTEDLTGTELLYPTREERLAAAYRFRNRRVAYSEHPRHASRAVREARRA
jgi:hypothetical protein